MLASTPLSNRDGAAADQSTATRCGAASSQPGLVVDWARARACDPRETIAAAVHRGERFVVLCDAHELGICNAWNHRLLDTRTVNALAGKIRRRGDHPLIDLLVPERECVKEEGRHREISVLLFRQNLPGSVRLPFFQPQRLRLVLRYIGGR